MVELHGENPNVDYMLKFNSIIEENPTIPSKSDNMKVIDAFIGTERTLRGLHIEFISVDNLKEGDIVDLTLDGKNHHFEIRKVEILGDDLKITAKETGYWATKLDREQNFDLRTLIGLEITPVTNPDTIKDIRIQACWC